MTKIEKLKTLQNALQNVSDYSIKRKALIELAASNGLEENVTWCATKPVAKGAKRGTYAVSVMLSLINKRLAKLDKSYVAPSTHEVVKAHDAHVSAKSKVDDDFESQVAAENAMMTKDHFSIEASYGWSLPNENDIADELSYMDAYNG
jgi:hypothetical protein